MYYLYFFLLYHKLDVYQGDVQVSCLPNFASNYRYNKNTTCLILLYRLFEDELNLFAYGRPLVS